MTLAAQVLGAGWRAFLDPLDVHDVWFLFLVPLALGIAVAYKAARLPTMERYWVHVLRMTVQIVLGMMALGAASYVFIMVYVRLIAERG